MSEDKCTCCGRTKTEHLHPRHPKACVAFGEPPPAPAPQTVPQAEPWHDAAESCVRSIEAEFMLRDDKRRLLVAEFAAIMAKHAPKPDTFPPDAAIESAAKMLLFEFNTRKCDNDGVAQCLRCNVVFLARMALKGHIAKHVAGQGGAKMEPSYHELMEICDEQKARIKTMSNRLTAESHRWAVYHEALAFMCAQSDLAGNWAVELAKRAMNDGYDAYQKTLTARTETPS